MVDNPLNEEECNLCFDKIAKRSSDRLELEGELAELRKYDIPSIVKESLNEAIYCYIFRAYTASIVICRSIIESSLKYLIIQKSVNDIKNDPARQDIIITNISKSTLFQIENYCDLLGLLDEEDRKKIRAIRILGNVHIHGDFERRNKEYLKNEEIKAKVIKYCKNLKILDFLLEPTNMFMELGPEDAPEEIKKVSQDELKWITEQYPDIIKKQGVKDMSLFVLKTSFDLIKKFFQQGSGDKYV